MEEISFLQIICTMSVKVDVCMYSVHALKAMEEYLSQSALNLVLWHLSENNENAFTRGSHFSRFVVDTEYQI
jgi:hypothetical protein